MLYLIGIGLDSEKDITLKGLEAVKSCDFVYLENYTSKLNCKVEKLEKLYGKKIILANRETVESDSNEILDKAKKNNVALLIVGDVFSATTHTDLVLRAKKIGVQVKTIHNTSVINAVSETGLELYKFGAVTSIVFPEENYAPDSFYDVIKENKKIGLHTLCLLDIKSDKKKFMTVNDAIEILLEIEKRRNEKVFTEETKILGCARLGSKNQKIVFKSAKEVLKENFGAGMHCLVVPGKLHFIEEEFLDSF